MCTPIQQFLSGYEVSESDADINEDTASAAARGMHNALCHCIFPINAPCLPTIGAFGAVTSSVKPLPVWLHYISLANPETSNILINSRPDRTTPCSICGEGFDSCRPGGRRCVGVGVFSCFLSSPSRVRITP